LAVTVEEGGMINVLEVVLVPKHPLGLQMVTLHPAGKLNELIICVTLMLRQQSKLVMVQFSIAVALVLQTKFVSGTVQLKLPQFQVICAFAEMMLKNIISARIVFLVFIVVCFYC
jgi:hypothetical protein